MKQEQIKVGDKVRVSKDIPQFYRKYNSYRVFEVEHQVEDIEDGLALLDSIPSKYVATLPLKYLIKVDAEAKEQKFKVGDKVEELVSRKSGMVLSIEGDIVVVGIPYNKEKHYWHIDSVELVQPKEQTEETSPNVNHSDIDIDTIVARGYIPDPNSFFKCDWDAYTADLAKEIAVKLSNPNENKPGYVADYAVSAAKAVVENLKAK